MSEASSMDCRVGPRVRTVFQDDDSGHYRYRGNEIEIAYEQPRDCWYIVVTASNGIKAYDGWWRDSSGKTHREAVLEALRGAMLWPNTEAQRTAAGGPTGAQSSAKHHERQP